MILFAAAALCLLSVPLTGGKLRRLADIHLRGMGLPVVALALQVVLTVIAAGGDPALHRIVHIGTYVLIGLFLWSNRDLPGLKIISLGTALNTLAIVANGGVMPASQTAQRLAGLHLHGGFQNSAAVAHPLLLWLGDVIPWPGPLPNVLSIGDVCVYAGTLVLLHLICRRPAQRPIALRPVSEHAAFGRELVLTRLAAANVAD